MKEVLYPFYRYLPLRFRLFPRQPKYRYLVIGNSGEYEFLDPIYLSKEEIYTYNWSNSVIYILLGKYEEYESYLLFLRSRGISVISDQKFVTPDNNKPMWKRRLSVVEAIYAHLVTEDLSNVNNLDFLDRSEWIDFETQIFECYSKNKFKYIQIINDFLKEGWELNRINLITTAILLEAVAEFDTFNTPKYVLISQSIKTAKNYCGDEEFRFVNGLLENLFK